MQTAQWTSILAGNLNYRGEMYLAVVCMVREFYDPLHTAGQFSFIFLFQPSCSLVLANNAASLLKVSLTL
jgi:hypothetical protein